MSGRAVLFGGDPTWTAVWETVCRHVDGLAMSSTVAALHERGLLAELAAAGPRGVRLGELAGRHGARAGFLVVAVRVLADQGWLLADGDPDDPVLRLLPHGRAMLPAAGCYAAAGPALELAGSLARPVLDGLVDPGPMEPCVAPVEARWHLPPTLDPGVRALVTAHLDGCVLGPVMAALALRGFRDGPGEQPDGHLPQHGQAVLDRLFAPLGWAVPGTGQLTPAGRVARRCAVQYWHPVTYLRTLLDVPGLLFGSLVRTHDAERASESGEAHLDRALDLHCSAQVFRSTCRPDVLAAVRPSFDGPLAGQPSAVVDVGCGDGTMLAAVWEHVRERTSRGRQLAGHPLLMVGVEPSSVGRSLTEQTLRAGGARVLTVAGDVGDPAGIAALLRARGVDPEDALWLTKSVLHDRDHPVRDAAQTPQRPPLPVDPGAAEDGSLVRGADVARSLVTVLRRWTPLVRRHGFVVVEAHRVPTAVTVAALGQGVTTMLDATQGYSCQYLVGPEVFGWAVEQAGWRSRWHAEPAADVLGYTVLTVDCFDCAPG